MPAEPVDTSTIILAQTSTGRPLVIRHQLGKGSVYTCTVPWYEGPLGQFAGPALRMIDNIIEPIQPVVIQGLPVEWLSTHGPARRTVLVANHNEQEWKGLVTVRNIPGNTKKCVELLTGKVIRFETTNNQATVKLKIPRFDIRILRWE